MIVAPIRSRSLFEGKRLDARYFTSAGVRSNERLVLHAAAGTKMVQIGGSKGVGSVQHTTRFKRLLASPSEASVPFLRAFDVFEYLPEPADLISETRTPDLDELRIEAGVILLTRSGRNLGPCVLADDYLAQFIPSDDLLRIRIDDEDLRLYIFAFLNTPTGQDVLRLDRTGSVIDHLSASQVARQSVPLVAAVYDEVVADTRAAHSLRGTSRLTLSAAVREIEHAVGTPETTQRLRDGWKVSARNLGGRLDAAFHQPDIKALRDMLVKAGGVRLGDIADVRKPSGRFKTYYVNEDHGRPLLSGRHILQFVPIAAKHIAASRSLREQERYELKAGQVACQADGRAEENLGKPIVITPERHDWLASGHVARITPHDESDTGWVWACMASTAVRRQMSAAACGSVVDALYESDIANIVLPARDTVDSEALWQAWVTFDEANSRMLRAVSTLEAALEIVG